MTSASKVFRTLGLGSLLVACASLASAATITYISPGDFTGAFVCDDETSAACYSATAWSDTGGNTVSLKGFNTALGTLTRVSITATAYAYGTYRIQNLTAGTITFDEFISNMSTVIVKPATATPYGTAGFFPATALANGSVWLTLRPQLFDLTNGSYLAGADTGNVSYATLGAPSQDTQTVTICATSGAGCTTGATSQTLSAFFGAGSVSIPVYANATTSVINGTGGNLALSTTTNAMIEISSITYTYTPASVPEPGTYLMMVAGLGGLVFARRRMAKS